MKYFPKIGDNFYADIQRLNDRSHREGIFKCKAIDNFAVVADVVYKPYSFGEDKPILFRTMEFEFHPVSEAILEAVLPKKTIVDPPSDLKKATRTQVRLEFEELVIKRKLKSSDWYGFLVGYFTALGLNPSYSQVSDFGVITAQNITS